MKKVLLGSVLATTLFASNGAVFAERTATTQTKKDVTQELDTNLQLPENGGFDGKVPNNKSEQKNPSLGRTGSDRAKAWGFSYVPKGMSTANEIALEERGVQNFDLNVHPGEESTYNLEDQNIHIGVKNKTRQKNSWTLQAKLDAEFSYEGMVKLNEQSNPLTGATFKLQNTQAKENKTNESTFSREGEIKLQELSEGELKTPISGEKEINTSANNILEGNANIVHNAVYDYAFNGAKFNVPNVRRMPVGEYQTRITWTLQQAPAAEKGE